ncbi:uncharacterized protein [Watersipora subatra]|uniref:uncharacterized protein n=1 Tax=Watersipora subatra TaxID=2589382 RepID=UPI00355BADF9
MRPDEHRRKKNEVYKKKHNMNTQTPQKRRQSEDPKIASNADRYDEAENLSSQLAGQNLKELLATVYSSHTMSSKEEHLLEDAGDLLSLDTSSIARVVGCYPLDELIRLKATGLMKAELKEISGETRKTFSNYIETHMDPVYKVDHGSVEPLTRREIILRNTGKWSAKTGQDEEMERHDYLADRKHPADDSYVGGGAGSDLKAAIPNEKVVTIAKGAKLDEEAGELEEWLDTLLDE